MGATAGTNGPRRHTSFGRGRTRTLVNDELAAQTVWHGGYRKLQFSLDAGALVVAFGIARVLSHLRDYDSPSIIVGLAIVAVFLLGATLRGAYADSKREGSIKATLALLGAYAWTGLMVVAGADHLGVSRTYGLVFTAMAFLLGAIARIALRVVLHSRRRDGKWQHRTIVVGSESEVVDLITHFRRTPEAGFRPIAACLTEGTGEHLARVGVTRLDNLRSLSTAVAAFGADAVTISAQSNIGAAEMRRILWSLEASEVGVILAPGIRDVSDSRVHLDTSSGLPLLHIALPEPSGLRRVAKEVMDRLLAVFALIFFAPLLISAALAIRLGSKGPALFRQTRVGKDGRLFVMLKFRTMYTDTQQRQLMVRAALTDRTEGLLFKIRDDPRITRVGRLLRKFSIDEFPQLLNVLTGSMSLVGPRPPLIEEVELYEDDVRRRLLVKPGLTGLWQISGRSDLAWDESVRLDLLYVENWSLALDFMILWKTVAAITRQRGAY